jgi:hypothetical protein
VAQPQASIHAARPRSAASLSEGFLSLRPMMPRSRSECVGKRLGHPCCTIYKVRALYGTRVTANGVTIATIRRGLWPGP